MRHSLADGALQVLCNVAALRMVGAHPLSRIVHNIVVTFLLAESHAGFDLPWMLPRVVPLGLYGGAIKHELHHSHGAINFSAPTSVRTLHQVHGNHQTSVRTLHQVHQVHGNQVHFQQFFTYLDRALGCSVEQKRERSTSASVGFAVWARRCCFVS